MFELEPSLR